MLSRLTSQLRRRIRLLTGEGLAFACLPALLACVAAEPARYCPDFHEVSSPAWAPGVGGFDNLAAWKLCKDVEHQDDA